MAASKFKAERLDAAPSIQIDSTLARSCQQGARDLGTASYMTNVSDSALAGSLSGVFTRLLVSPLDVIKVRMQLQIEPTSTMQVIYNDSKYRGLFHAARTILREEGMWAFWKGFLAGQALYVVFGVTQFPTYELLRGNIKFYGDVSTSGKTAADFASGCIAGGAATAASFPFDVLRTRMISQGKPKVYPNLYRGAVMMYSESGIGTFYKGLFPALLSVAPQSGLQFAIFMALCRVWDSWTKATTDNNNNPSRSRFGGSEELKWVSCGGVAGIISKVVMLPFDIVKKRLEVQGFEQARRSFGRVEQYRGPVHCLTSIYKQEGMLAFYKGASPSILKATLSVSVAFTIYKKVLKHLDKLRTHQ